MKRFYIFSAVVAVALVALSLDILPVRCGTAAASSSERMPVRHSAAVVATTPMRALLTPYLRVKQRGELPRERQPPTFRPRRQRSMRADSGARPLPAG